MNYSGDAAEQVVRLSLETAEVAAKITGEGAKQIAILLYALLRDQKKTRGKTRLTSMLRSGKELKVFAVRDQDLEQFCKAAKQYGVLYCVLKDKNANDGITDIMVRAEDASKINRIFERFDLATVDLASLKSEIERARMEQDVPEPEPEPDEPPLVLALPPGAEPPKEEDTFIPVAEDDEQDVDAFLDILLALPPVQEEQEEERAENPTGGRTAKSRQSEPTSEYNGPSEQGTTSDVPERSRPSVRQELNEIKAEQRQNAARDKDRSAPQKPAQHKAPRKKKPRSR